MSLPKTISIAELRDLLAKKPGLALIDVRTPEEYSEVHAVPARSEPLATLNPTALYDSGKLAKGEPVYLICATDRRASRAAEQFGAQGFVNTVVVTGGTVAWVEAGLPVVRGPGRGMRLVDQVRILAGGLVLAGLLLGALVHPGFLAISGIVGVLLVSAGLTGYSVGEKLLAKLSYNKDRRE